MNEVTEQGALIEFEPSKHCAKLVRMFYEKYKSETGKRCMEVFWQCYGATKAKFEGVVMDELLIEYPTVEDWADELDKFFFDSPANWYRQNRKLHFALFIKHFGEFDSHRPEKKRKPSDPELNHVCKNGHETKYLRSVWERGRNRSMKCPVEGCEERIIVNNILAQIPDLTQFIPICTDGESK